MAADIGVKLGIDGAASFNSAIKLAAQQVRSLSAEMKAITSQFQATDKSEKNLTQQNQALARSIQAAKDQAALLKGEIERQSGVMNGLADAAARAAHEFGENSAQARRANDEYIKQATTVERLTTQFNNAEANVNKLSNQLGANEDTLKNVKRGYNDAGQKVDEFGNVVEKTAAKTSTGVGTIVKAMGLMKAATAALNLVKNSIGDAFARIDTMEQFERTMTVMTGSAETAKLALDKVTESVSGTAYGLSTAAASVQNFVTSGMDISKATEQVRIWGDAVAFYSDGTNESLQTVTDALTKMVATGKVQGEQLNRITERGIPALRIYAEATGKTVEQVRKDLSSGAISAEEFADTMVDAMASGTTSFKSIEGAAKEAGMTWGAVFDNMKAAVARGMTTLIETLDESLGEAGMGTLRENIAAIGTTFESVMKVLAKAIPTIITVLKPLIPVLIGVASAILMVKTYLGIVDTIKGITEAAGFLNDIFGKKVNVTLAKTVIVVLAVAAAVAILAAAISTLLGKSEDFQKNMSAVSSTMSGASAAPGRAPGYASGTNFAPGGLSLLGERGPELVNLPRGAQVYTSQKSQAMLGGGNSYYNITIDAKNVKEFNDVVKIAEQQRVRSRMGSVK